VAEYVNKPEIQRYITEVYLNSGYRNRFKIAEVMDTIIEKKLQEMEEAEIGSSKDIMEIMQAAHKMRMDEIDRMIELEKAKQKKPANQTNIQINQGPKRSIFETLIEDVTELP
jgi:phage terminase small subunit